MMIHLHFQQTDELRRQLTAQQKLIEKHKDNLQKCLNVNKTLLIEKVSRFKCPSISYVPSDFHLLYRKKLKFRL